MVKIFFWMYEKVSPLRLDQNWLQNVRFGAWRGVQDEKGRKAREKAFAHDSMLKISMPRHLAAQSNACESTVWNEMGMHDTCWHDIA